MTEDEEKTETEENGEEINAEQYEGEGEPSPVGGEEKPETESEESKETFAGTSADLAVDFLTADLPQAQAKQFEEKYKPIAKPLGELTGVQDGYQSFIEKAKKLPWPIRLSIGVFGLMGSGVFLKSRITGRSFKGELQSTMTLSGNNSGGTESEDDFNPDDWKDVE